MGEPTSIRWGGLTGEAELARLSARRPEYARAERVWRDSLGPALAARESRRQAVIEGAMKKSVIGFLVAVLGYLVLLFVTRGAFGSLFQGFLLVALLSVVAVSGFDWLRVYSMKSHTKDLILSEACALFGFRYETLHPDVSNIQDLKSLQSELPKLIAAYTGRNTGETAGLKTAFGYMKAGAGKVTGPEPPTPAYGVMSNAGLIETHASRRFEDLIQGERAGANFSLVEAKLKSGGKNDQTVFQGILVHIEYPESFLGRTYIARKGWRFWRGAPTGMQKVDLVSRELNDAFTVYSTDQVEARALLTPDRMERLIALERHFSGGKLRAVFEQGHMTIALEAEDQFEAGGIMKTLINPQRFISALSELGLVCDLIDGFLTRDWIRNRT